ncbi:hypothetical protein GTY65_36555 [Streptomyces sp. SID8379]|uniref:hypothetical protein n=1 Tax=unclassified Streptomyces TaxID=2593676 RepID=UPI00036A9117|nr:MULTISPECIES: hypothetical protein [unclassified Streptomyces]MYW69539.1 hypothetical protein [Streptomyces sp. SID8379]
MSQNDDKNAPLPRTERDAALKWAKDFTAYMAEASGAELVPTTEKVNFEECTGAHDELAEDGRYSLFYYVYSSAPSTQHTQMVRTLRDSLQKHGYKVTDYREFKDAYSSALLWAENEKNNYRVMAETVGSGKTKPQRFSFAVRTPCMLPPGVKQQQF